VKFFICRAEAGIDNSDYKFVQGNPGRIRGARTQNSGTAQDPVRITEK